MEELLYLKYLTLYFLITCQVFLPPSHKTIKPISGGIAGGEKYCVQKVKYNVCSVSP